MNNETLYYIIVLLKRYGDSIYFRGVGVRKIRFVSIFIVLVSVIFASCGKKNYQAFDGVGIKFEKSKVWQDYSKNLSMTEVGGEGDCGIIVDFIADNQTDVYPLFIVAIIDSKVISEETFRREVGGDVADLEKLGQEGSKSRYFVSYDVQKICSLLGLAQDQLPEKYLELLKTFPSVKKSLVFYEPTKKENPLSAIPEKEAESSSLLRFSSVDLEGKPVDTSIFSAAKITMVNVWGTFCGPCINEMPELASLAEEIKDQGGQIVGFVCDVQKGDSDGITLAKDILSQSGVSYTNVLYNTDIDSLLGVQAVPTSFLVDSEGNILGESILGARSKAAYLGLIRAALELK